MKRSGRLLIVSIALNIALVASLWKTSDLFRSNMDRDGGDPSSDDAAAQATATAENALRSDTLDELRSDDLAQFASNLRVAGFGDYLVRAIINAEIDERFREREAALDPKRPKVPYWQFDPTKESLNTRRAWIRLQRDEPVETRLARLDMEREKARLRREVLGPDETDERDLPFSAEKWRLAEMIAEDYDTIIGALRHRHLLLPAEREMVDRLETEKRAELETLLTADELAEFDFRSSDFLNMLSRELGDFNATEEEFRAIYDLRMQHEERMRSLFVDLPDPGESPEDRLNRVRASFTLKEEEKQRVRDELSAALGEGRLADYERERDYDYRALKDMAERMGLPAEAARQVYELRDHAARESERIGHDYSRSVAERRAAMAELAQETAEQVESVLGSEGARAYLGSPHTTSWIRSLESGKIVSFDANQRSVREISERPPPDL